MNLDLVYESWQELRKFINTMDRSDAAEGLVSVLIENGIAAEDIHTTFGSDADVRSALGMYIDDQDIEEEEYDQDTDDDY